MANSNRRASGRRPTPRDETAEGLLERTRAIAAIVPTSLARTDELSPQINFEEAVPAFAELSDLFTQLSQRELSRLPTPELDKIGQACGTLENLVTRVKEFDLNQNTPKDVCNGIITDVQNAYDGIMNRLMLSLAFTATQATDYARLEREAKGFHATIQEEAEDTRQFLEECRSQANEALAAVRAQAAEAGVATNAQIFLQDSQLHNKAASRWLWATIVMAVITTSAAVVAVYLSFRYHPPSTAAAIQYVVSKIILLSTLSFGVYWCAQNFKSGKHNETLNKHRANALMTFRAFVEGTQDSSVKDAVLIQACQAAFGPRPTGYDGADKDGQTVHPIVEVVGRSAPRLIDSTSH